MSDNATHGSHAPYSPQPERFEMPPGRQISSGLALAITPGMNRNELNERLGLATANLLWLTHNSSCPRCRLARGYLRITHKFKNDMVSAATAEDYAALEAQLYAPIVESYGQLALPALNAPDGVSLNELMQHTRTRIADISSVTGSAEICFVCRFEGAVDALYREMLLFQHSGHLPTVVGQSREWCARHTNALSSTYARAVNAASGQEPAAEG